MPGALGGLERPQSSPSGSAGIRLDFCNTWAGWAETDDGDVSREWLRDYGDLLAWAHYAELMDGAPGAAARRRGGAAPRQAALVLEQARALQAALYAALLDRSDADSLPR